VLVDPVVIPWLFHGYSVVTPWLFHGYFVVMSIVFVCRYAQFIAFDFSLIILFVSIERRILLKLVDIMF